MKPSIRLTILGAIAIAAFPVAASAQSTVGNPAVTAPNVDNSNNLTVILNQPFAAAGETVSSYSFYAGRSLSYTPLLFSSTTAGTTSTFTVLGVGTTQTSALGVNNFAFGLTSGTDVTTASTYFGLYTPGQGVADFAYDTGQGGVNSYDTTTSGAAMVGTTYSFDNSTSSQNPSSGLNTRIYSINAVGTGPEPTSWALMVGGFGLAGGMLRRRRRLGTAAAMQTA